MIYIQISKKGKVVSTIELDDVSELETKAHLISRVADGLVEKYLVITEQNGEVIIQSTMGPEELLFHIEEIKNRIKNCIKYH